MSESVFVCVGGTGWAVVDETLGDFFGLNDSKYQWAVDEYFKEHEQVRGLPLPHLISCLLSVVAKALRRRTATPAARMRTDADHRRTAGGLCGSVQKERRRELRRAKKAAKAAAEVRLRLAFCCDVCGRAWACPPPT